MHQRTKLQHLSTPDYRQCNILSLEDVVVDGWWRWLDFEDGRPKKDSSVGEGGEVSVEGLAGYEDVGLTSNDGSWDLAGCDGA